MRNRQYTLLRVASAGLVYWVAWFFLLGTKARILGLTFGGSSGIGKASDPIPTPAGGKSGRHLIYVICCLSVLCFGTRTGSVGIREAD